MNYTFTLIIVVAFCKTFCVQGDTADTHRKSLGRDHSQTLSFVLLRGNSPLNCHSNPRFYWIHGRFFSINLPTFVFFFSSEKGDCLIGEANQVYWSRNILHTSLKFTHKMHKTLSRTAKYVFGSLRYLLRQKKSLAVNYLKQLVNKRNQF